MIKLEIRGTNRIRCVHLSTFYYDIGICLFVYFDTQISLNCVYIWKLSGSWFGGAVSLTSVKRSEFGQHDPQQRLRSSFLKTIFDVQNHKTTSRKTLKIISICLKSRVWTFAICNNFRSNDLFSGTWPIFVLELDFRVDRFFKSPIFKSPHLSSPRDLDIRNLHFYTITYLSISVTCNGLIHQLTVK